MRASAVVSFDTKSTSTDVVTAADRASEQLVRTRLSELRPGEPVLGEEEGGTVELAPGSIPQPPVPTSARDENVL